MKNEGQGTRGFFNTNARTKTEKGEEFRVSNAQKTENQKKERKEENSKKELFAEK
jgi:hypothetical protein